MTGGVMSRVAALADRSDGFRPEGAKPFHSLVPLRELIGEVVDAGPGSLRVQRVWERLLARVGPELSVLTAAPCEDVAREAPPLLDEALRRVRRGEVQVRAGYDGEYGVVRVFDEAERRRLLAQTSFAFSFARRAAPVTPPAPVAIPAPVPRPVVRSGLDEPQARVVEHGEGPLLVMAGPGTGKTRAVVQRIARLIRERGVSARAITAITFTRKAAGELRERLAALLGPAAAPLCALTFHAFGLELLRAFPAAAGLPADFTILDDEGRQRLVEGVLAETAADLTPARTVQAIARAKAELAPAPPPFADLHAAYERALAAQGCVDQDDLVARAVRLLEQSAEALAHARDRARYLFVDEYQDVNTAQDRLVRLLAPPEPTSNLCVVGDPDQAIYGFRGADPAHFARFARDYPATTLALTRNHRSSRTVVRAASAVIAASAGRTPRPLESIGEEGPRVLRLLAADEQAEGGAIAAEIERAVGGMSLEGIAAGRGDGEATLAFHDVAVLVRLTAQADVLAELFTREGIPFHRAGGDGVSAPATTLEAEIEPQKVALLTLHASKGLEFPLVFIAGCEDGLLPLAFPSCQLEEERRLLYVGMTRARQRLVLTSAHRRRLFGRRLEPRPSPFLAALPAELLEERLQAARPRRPRQLGLF
jgi:DNA helicase-2/ATP-dependent DNA helicase PcrA